MVKEEIIERYGLPYYEELKNRIKLIQKLKYQSSKEYRDSQKSKTHGQMQSKYVKNSYYSCPPNELIWLTHKEHISIHHKHEC